MTILFNETTMPPPNALLPATTFAFCTNTVPYIDLPPPPLLFPRINGPCHFFCTCPRLEIGLLWVFRPCSSPILSFSSPCFSFGYSFDFWDLFGKVADCISACSDRTCNSKFVHTSSVSWVRFIKIQWGPNCLKCRCSTEGRGGAGARNLWVGPSMQLEGLVPLFARPLL